ncbi:MAG: UDP-N-acetylglucosamine 2-epimerase (non-hydrolyzing) [Bacteroidetes bacterium]|nr:UDP-N-acetylglucosamine 2-epimerase (non-hydrolyzing) [Bacteroidota bacterium]
MKVLNIVGARPQIIKASAISRTIKESYSGKFKEIIVHTGQHYDKELSSVFFDELHIPKPHHNLRVGSARHSKQTAFMMTGLEDLILKKQPDCVIVYGDTNSTLAGALAASKLHCPVVHIEAGLRSYNKNMPEEINRIMCDHVSTLLFSPTNSGFKNLIREGFRPENSPPYTIDNPKIFHSGDIMYDNSLFYGELAEKKKKFLAEIGVKPGEFILATIHRDNNTDIPARLKSIFEALLEIARGLKIPVVLPLHPRTTLALEKKLPKSFYNVIKKEPLLKIMPPVSFLEVILLEKNARLIMTDSGGIQKEAHFFRKPCIIFRKETEWVELVKNKTSVLVDADKEKIIEAVTDFGKKKEMNFPKFYGDGKTAGFICEELVKNFG